MKTILVAAAAAILAQTAPALAEPLAVYPIQTGSEQARYRLGSVTLMAASASGRVQITPLDFDHGNVSFGVVVFNQSAVPVNFGAENITVSSQGQQLALFTRTQLQQKAQARATWAKIGNAVATTLEVGGAAGQHDTYVSGVRVGNVSAVSVYKDYSPGRIAAGNVWAAGLQTEAAIQARLDDTLDHLAQEILQTTTVDPGMPLAGRMVIAGNGKLKLPYDLRIVVSFSGTDYPFTFRVTKIGQYMPAPFTGTPATLASLAPPPAPLPPAALASTFRQAGYIAQQSAPPASAPQLSSFDAGRLAAAAQMAASGGESDQ